jgi:hypothetical protein
LFDRYDTVVRWASRDKSKNKCALDKNRFIFKIILASSVILEGEKKLGRFKKKSGDLGFVL